MSDQDFYNSDEIECKPSRQAMSGWAKVGLGCGIITLVLMVISVIAIWYVMQNLREVGSAAAAVAMKEGIKELKLPANEQRRIFDRIDKVAQRFKDEEITFEEIVTIFEKISQGPLFPAGMSLVVERAYLDESQLDEDEKDAAKITIQRFTHGTIQQEIPQAKVDAVLDTISTRGRENERKFRHPISDVELRKFIAEAKAAAAEADIPNDVPKINFADEFDKAIDQALEREQAVE